MLCTADRQTKQKKTQNNLGPAVCTVSEFAIVSARKAYVLSRSLLAEIGRDLFFRRNRELMAG